MKQEIKKDSDAVGNEVSTHPSKGSELGYVGFHTRLRKILEGFRSNNAFATAAGISPSGLNRLIEGGYPTLPVLVAIAKAGGVNVEWLSTGVEAVAIQKEIMPLNQSSAGVTDVRGNNVALDEFVFVPRYDISAAAGHGTWVDDETPMFTVSFRKYWVTQHLKADPSKLSVISVYGDSMEGVLNDKDIILINHADREPREGIYVLRIDGQLIVKRIQRVPGNQIHVTSTNPAYQPFTINLNNLPDDFDILGKVVWFGRVV